MAKVLQHQKDTLSAAVAAQAQAKADAAAEAARTAAATMAALEARIAAATATINSSTSAAAVGLASGGGRGTRRQSSLQPSVAATGGVADKVASVSTPEVSHVREPTQHEHQQAAAGTLEGSSSVPVAETQTRVLCNTETAGQAHAETVVLEGTLPTVPTIVASASATKIEEDEFALVFTDEDE